MRDAAPLATVTLQWEDGEFWGEQGRDGRAGYVHGLAVMRSCGCYRTNR